MFSCLLLHSQSYEQPVVATRCDTRLHTVGSFAHGAISVRFDLSQQMTDAVLYVPTLCVYHVKGRTHLRVTGCKFTRERSGGAVTVQHFTLRRTPELSSLRQPKHSYSEIKRRCYKAVSRWGGVQSSRDFILQLGTMERGSSLTVELDLVASIEPQVLVGDVRCTFGSMLPAHSHFLDVTVYRRSEVRLLPMSFQHPGDVEPSVSWTHCKEDTFTRVQGSVAEWTVTEPFGLTLQLQTPDGGELAAEVASLLLPRPISVDSPSGERLQTIDGLLLLNCMLKSPAHLGDTRPRFAPSEFIFLVDCSGSMSGLKIQMASETLILCLKSLPRGCHFNIIAFGSKYYHLFPSSEEISEKMLEKGVQFANQLKACLGGTELLTPIRWLLRRAPCNGLARQVFLITDGGAPNHQAVLQAVTKHKRDTR